jgi:hypothetical protein
LKKAIGKADLTYEKLLTLQLEIEAVFNVKSRPISYISMDNLEEPLSF